MPAPVFFRVSTIPANSVYPRHSHGWGEFVYSFSGVLEIRLADRHYLAPPQYGIWLPAGVEHQGLSRYEACHCSLYIAEALCAGLPRQTCALTVSPLVRSILEHLRQNPPPASCSEADQRLLRVLADQLATAQCAGSYLPTTDDPVLAPMLRALEENPGDSRSLQELAQAANSTERTIMRRCQRELGMTFSEWRKRLKVVRSLPLLESGQTVETIAFDLGYSSSSAFIAMFRRLMGITPDEFRKSAAIQIDARKRGDDQAGR